ncbi:MAG: hypothetical protein LC808_03430 [Actinobacteria bacterium]|nr:hypothetical protein [Actinomycetota bacterium]
MDDLVPYPSTRPTRRQRATAEAQQQVKARKTQEVYDHAHLTAMKTDASMALAAHVMEGALDLDNYRKELAQGDPATNLLLAEFESTAMQQVKRLQRSLYNPWAI